jgi:hypothetical protein
MKISIDDEIILTGHGLKYIPQDKNRKLNKAFFNIERYEKINYKFMSSYVYNKNKHNQSKEYTFNNSSKLDTITNQHKRETMKSLTCQTTS